MTRAQLAHAELIARHLAWFLRGKPSYPTQDDAAYRAEELQTLLKKALEGATNA